MKKFILFCMVFIMLLPATAQAKVGDVIGTAYNTDIVAYINHYAIPSYAVNGTSCIVAEDLKNFGFNVTWDNDTRSLNISQSGYQVITPMQFSKTAAPSTKFADLLETDIAVYANGVKLTSYAINGYTMIPIEELTMFGTCSWVNEERAIKLWLDNMPIRWDKQTVKSYQEVLNDIAREQAKANYPVKIVLKNELPKMLNTYNYMDKIKHMVRVTDFDYEVTTYSWTDEQTVTLYLSGAKLYDIAGTKNNNYCEISWKLYSESGSVVKSGTCYSSEIAEGESFTNAKDYIWSVKPGTYYLELVNTNGF